MEFIMYLEPAAGAGAYRTLTEMGVPDHVIRVDGHVWDQMDRPAVIRVQVEAVPGDVVL